MKIKTAAAILGLALIIVGLGYLGYLIYMGHQARHKSVSAVEHRYYSAVTPCTLKNIKISKLYLTENDSFSIAPVFQNDTNRPCVLSVQLSAINFDSDPPERVQSKTLDPKTEEFTLIWTLSPTKTGAREISVTTGYKVFTYVVSVVNTLGLTPLRAKILSIITSFFGSALTLPWWVDFVRGLAASNRRTAEPQT